MKCIYCDEVTEDNDHNCYTIDEDGPNEPDEDEMRMDLNDE